MSEMHPQKYLQKLNDSMTMENGQALGIHVCDNLANLQVLF